ncbi:MAG: hypothetical protein R6U57_03770 [Anaerolineales bacterium]
MKKRLGMLIAITGMLVVGCAKEVKPPTCDVYTSNNQIHVVIDLPAEGTEYHDRHDLNPPGTSGTPSRVKIESGGSSMEYVQSGNTYDISYIVTYENGEIKSYDISIKGSVYGDVEHTCTK